MRWLVGLDGVLLLLVHPLTGGDSSQGGRSGPPGSGARRPLREGGSPGGASERERERERERWRDQFAAIAFPFCAELPRAACLASGKSSHLGRAAAPSAVGSSISCKEETVDRNHLFRKRLVTIRFLKFK